MHHRQEYVIPDGTVIGQDRHQDEQKYFVSESGIVSYRGVPRGEGVGSARLDLGVFRLYRQREFRSEEKPLRTNVAVG